MPVSVVSSRSAFVKSILLLWTISYSFELHTFHTHSHIFPVSYKSEASLAYTNKQHRSLNISVWWITATPRQLLIPGRRGSVMPIVPISSTALSSDKGVPGLYSIIDYVRVKVKSYERKGVSYHGQHGLFIRPMKKYQNSISLALCEVTGHRWIPITKGQ